MSDERLRFQEFGFQRLANGRCRAKVVLTWSDGRRFEGSSDGVSSARADIPLAADWQRDQVKVVAFVQELRGRTILASASVPLRNTRP